MNRPAYEDLAAKELTHAGAGRAVATEVYALRTRGYGDVRAIVDEDFRRNRSCARSNALHQIPESCGRQVTLPDLNHIDACGDRFVQETFEPEKFVAFGASVGRECSPIGDQANTRPRQGDHGTGGEDSEAVPRARMTADRSRSPANAVTSPMPVTPPFTNAFPIHSPTQATTWAK